MIKNRTSYWWSITLDKIIMLIFLGSLVIMELNGIKLHNDLWLYALWLLVFYFSVTYRNSLLSLPELTHYQRIILSKTLIIPLGVLIFFSLLASIFLSHDQTSVYRDLLVFQIFLTIVLMLQDHEQRKIYKLVKHLPDPRT